jgi:hypothetical protein
MRVPSEEQKSHEIEVKQLRVERAAERRRLELLKARLQDQIEPRQEVLFAAPLGKAS